MSQINLDKRIVQAEQVLTQSNICKAIDWLKAELIKQPNFYQGWLLLSKYQFESGSKKEAFTTSRKAEQYDPLTNDFRQIQSHMQQRAFVLAEKCAQQMVSKIPHHPRALFTQAQIGLMTNNPQASIEVLKLGIEANPANLVLRQLIIDSYVAAGNFAQAIESAKALVDAQTSFESLVKLITLLLKYGQYDTLFAYLAVAEKHCGENPHKLSHIHLLYGQVNRIVGKREESIQAFQTCLKHHILNADAWWGLADMKNYVFSSQQRDAIAKVAQSPNLPKSLRCAASFALAKANEQGNTLPQVFKFYQQANNLRDTRGFDPKHIDAEIEARIKGYSETALATQAPSKTNPATPTPIFIVGLPRSGSTLVEQMLACHSQIQGTIEQPTLPAIENTAHSLAFRKYNKGLMGALAEFSTSDLSHLGKAYIDNGALFRQENKSFFTDKLPFNFRLIGLIHKILPDAVILDIRRHPLDCGLSLYKQYFPSGVEFSYKLEHIGAFYTAYDRMMAHWDKVLPGKVLRVQYESLVHSPEENIKRILNHADLDFEPACLNFHTSKRRVHTASSEQVRQPINRNSIGIWQNFEKELAPLRQTICNNILAKL